MRFDVMTLTNHVAGVDPPYDVFYQQLLEQIQLAEELGFGGAWFNEHHFFGYGGLDPNPAAMLLAVAGRTSRIRLGSSVAVLPLRHPLHVAEEYAMVDAISSGRLEFGVGVGSNPREYAPFGVPFEDGHARFDEALEIILAAWSCERFSYQGRFWQFDDVSVFSSPVQRPHPPLWIASRTPATLERIGRLGRNIMTVAHPQPPELVRPGVEAWQRGLAKAGHDPATHHCLIHLRIFVGEDGARAGEIGQAAIGRYNALSREGQGRELQPSDTDFEALLATGRNVYGNPDQCIELLQRTKQHFDFDVCGLQFNFGGIPHADIVKSMRLFAAEVMPAL